MQSLRGMSGNLNWFRRSVVGGGGGFEKSHVLTCKVGGFHTLRHNQLRDTIADLLKEVCCNVSVEPHLQPLTGENFPASTNTQDEARLDVRARGFRDNCDQDAFFDIRVFYPFAPTYQESSMVANYRQHEQKKRREYGLRVREVDQESFTLLVFTTGGGTAPEGTVGMLTHLPLGDSGTRLQRHSLPRTSMFRRFHFSSAGLESANAAHEHQS